jgi:transcriptional regulator with GAF, ATPase, and Fis domain
MKIVSSLHEKTEVAGEAFRQLPDYPLEALRSLTMLLLREVEFLQNQGQNAGAERRLRKPNLFERTQQFEKDLICAALIKTHGSQVKAAKLLGTKLSTLNFKIKRYGIDTAGRHGRSEASKKG